MADLRKKQMSRTQLHVYVTLRWEAIILLCENLQFGASLHLHCVGLGWVWIGLGRGSINSPGRGLGWVDSVIWWVELGLGRRNGPKGTVLYIG